MNRKVFYDTLRPYLNLTTQNVFGTEKLLDYLEAHPMNTNRAAYVLATAWWETGQTMTPVKEAYWLSETWRKNSLRYFPYYGRGLVQTTWRDNYRKVGELIGKPSDFFVNDPDKLLEWKYAIPALFAATEAGIYTGKAWDDYIDLVDESDAEDRREYINARRVINGTDKALTIANIAIRFERALRKAGYSEKVVKVPNPRPDQGPPPLPPPPDIEPNEPAPRGGFFNALIRWIRSLF